MKNESIEFQSIYEGKESGQVVRQSFRVPVSDKKIIQVIIRKKIYSVSDISQRGVGISPDSRLDLEFNEILTGCELKLADGTWLKGLTGKVIHCSSTEPGQLQYGIQWIYLGTREKKILNEIFSQMKSGVLKNIDLEITKA
jgi:hypothetical protein